jgi:hypothetical protein
MLHEEGNDIEESVLPAGSTQNRGRSSNGVNVENIFRSR